LFGVTAFECFSFIVNSNCWKFG